MDRKTHARRESIGSGGYRIRAIATTDDQQYKARWDAEGWFLQAKDEHIVDLHADGYLGGLADALACFAQEQEGDKGLTKLFRYLTVWKPRTADRSIIGFEVRVNVADVFHWLAAHRPNLAVVLFPDGEPEFKEC